MPAYSCVVDGCSTSVATSGVSLFRFPKDPERCQNWKTALGFVGSHKNANLTPDQCYSRIKVCSLHFSIHSFSNQSKNRIHNSATPTLEHISSATGHDAEVDFVENVATSSNIGTTSVQDDHAQTEEIILTAAIKDETESGDDYGDFEDENISMEYTDPPEMKFTAEEESNTRVTESPNSSIHQPVIDNKPIEMNNVDDFSEIDSFFKGIVETVKKLSPVNQVLLQKQIANLVFDMKLKELQEQE